jgi:acyl transferase domain-containing protein/NAD(P)-dependent dehydrogenase (short-subunit alcohol dehydrogenase family)/acyl carrier protein
LASERHRGPSAAVIEAWIVHKLAEYLELASDAISVQEPFSAYGLASRDGLVLSGELEEWLERRLSPTLVYEHPTIEQLARFLADDSDSPVSLGSPPLAAPDADGLIAIVGIGCRVPGGSGREAFWTLLENGVDAIGEVPASRWSLSSLYDADAAVPGKMNTRWGGFLDPGAVESFDAAFFGISEREAVRMDPQQRLLLEVAWEALEDAGQAADKLTGTPTGVFVGISSNDYGQHQFSRPELSDPYAGTGNALSIAANRLSYVFGLHGPSLAVDTACSSSLVAIHLACRSLRDGECGMALVGGVNCILSPAITVNFSKAGFMAPDGRCKTFDARADGYVRSEGAGLVILKPLRQASADRDRIYAVIRGSAVNQDGRTNGLTAPSRQAQEAVLREAYRKANVVPGHVQYVETHGTGTALGDPIEIGALGAVLGIDRPTGSRCAVGSVKTNVGHLEAAAGITGLIKVALSLWHARLPASLHFESPNPHIPFGELPLFVQRTLSDWPPTTGPRLAGVSSFGFGGTNAHVVLEGPPAPETIDPDAPDIPGGTPYVLPISARGPAALQELAICWQAHLAQSDRPLADVCYTAAVRRSHHPHRLAIVGRTSAELSAALRRAAADPPPARRERPRVAFVFGGQGTQYAGMGRELLEAEPVFRAALERCDALIAPILGWSVLDTLRADADSSRLDQTVVAQPALFAIQVALTAVWRHWGVEPQAVLGHSLGEITAAHVAGVLSLEAAVRLVCVRGRLLQRAHGQGRMAAVALSAEEAGELADRYGPGLSVAAINGPRASVLAGEAEVLGTVLGELRARRVAARDLGGAYAFHVPGLAAIAADLEQELGEIAPGPAHTTLVSTLTGRMVRGDELNAQYWAQQIHSPVRFAAAAELLLNDGFDVFVEIAPQPALGQPLREQGAAVAVASLRRGRPERAELLASLGRLYSHGCQVDWERLYPSGTCVDLPAYPWQRKRYWLPAPTDSGLSPAARAPTATAHPLLGTRVSSPMIPESLFESQLTLSQAPFLRDHCIAGTTVLPASAYVELMLAAASQALGSGPWELHDLELAEAMALTDAESRVMQVALGQLTASGAATRIVSRETALEEATWRLHATATVHASVVGRPPDAATLEHAHEQCPDEVDVAEYYEQLRNHGLEYGPAFRGIASLQRGPNAALGRIYPPTSAGDSAARYVIHPSVLDACLQVMGAALGDEERGLGLMLPVGFERCVIYGGTASETWSYARTRGGPGPSGPSRVWIGDVDIFDGDGEPLATLVGVRIQHTRRAALAALASPRLGEWLYQVEWRTQPPGVVAAAVIDRGPWLLVGDQPAPGFDLAATLRTAGQVCTSVPDDDGLPGILASGLDGRPWRNVVHLASLADASGLGSGCASVLRLVQALAPLHVRPRLWLVTPNAQVLPTDAAPPPPTQAPVWGLAATLALEQPDLRCVCIDVDPSCGDVGGPLSAELLADGDEDRVALRGHTRYVARLVRGGGRIESAALPTELRLERSDGGTLEDLALRPMARRQPGAGEVEIQVRASGLNFRDVLGTLGLYPGDPGPPGAECAGVVAALGPDVDDLHIGDAVVAVAPGSFATYVTTRASLVAPKPITLSFQEAATIPIAFLTAAYAVRHHAHLESGERVLIHTATGGVGLAAVQLALQAGATIFATAGSAAKRDYLRSLGVEHVFDSRSLDFVDQVRQATAGQGVHVILNSLPGEYIPANLSLLCPRGRYVEIGKLGTWSEEDVGRLRPDVHYWLLDMAQVLETDHAFAGAMLRDLLTELHPGGLQPPRREVFDLHDAVRAFRLMAQAKHIGKIVLRHPPQVPRTGGAAQDTLRPDATYLVTGGLGALGLLTAGWLAQHGARHLVLVSRNAPKPDRAVAVDRLRAAGLQVRLAHVDVADADQLAGLLDQLAQTQPPIRGVVHAAGVLADGVLIRQDSARLEEVMRPKALGAWNLHVLLRDMPLDFFICFSSVASILGSPGQGNYSAANAFLDALAHFRRQHGLAATSINWGPWGGPGGMAAGRTPPPGVTALGVEQGLGVLSTVFERQPTQVAAVRIDWARALEDRPAIGTPAPLLADLALAVPVTADHTDRPQMRRAAFLRRLDETPPTQRRKLLASLLCDQIAAILGQNAPTHLDPQQPLLALGLDSLMAVELRNSLASITGHSLPATLLFDYPTVDAISTYLLRDVLGLEAEPAAADTPHDADDAAEEQRAKLEQLSADDMVALLARKLTTIGKA